MRPIRVLELFAGFAIEGPLGGSERFAIELCRHLDRSKVQPIACGLWDFGTVFEQQWLDLLAQENILAYAATAWPETSPYLGFWQAMKGIRALKEQHKLENIDIIHSHTQFTDVTALLLKRTLGAKVLIRTVHNEREWPKRPLRRLILTNWVYPLLFDLELGVSQQAAQNLNHRPGARLTTKKAQCAYNSINLERFKEVDSDSRAKKRDLGLPEDAIVVGSIGRLTKQKGYKFFVQAAKLILEKRPELKFIIVGGGELFDSLSDQISELDLKDHFILAGPRKNVETILPAFDVFVSSSLWEGLPTVILESFAAGVPVLATDVSGSRELVTSDYSGVLVPPGEARLLAQAILKILKEKDQREYYVSNAKQVLQNFTIPKIAAQYTKIYTDLAKS